MKDGLLLRYDTKEDVDGLPPGEGTFLVCSFWLADVYVLLGRHDDACILYDRLIGLCNDVGLLSEQYDPQARRMLGNFRRLQEIDVARKRTDPDDIAGQGNTAQLSELADIDDELRRDQT